MSRDSGISSIRESSITDFPRRDSSFSRGERLSTASVIESVAELRNKYSPANYVPACQRKNENISRSKSINDIGKFSIFVKNFSFHLLAAIHFVYFIHLMQTRFVNLI